MAVAPTATTKVASRVRVGIGSWLMALSVLGPPNIVADTTPPHG